MKTKKNILIVDPNEERLTNTCKLFAQQGYQVWPADSCELAVVSIGVRAPDLIIMDVKPEMKGFAFCKLIKEQERFEHIPVIFLSFSEQLCYKMKTLDLGEVNFIAKPYDRAMLFDMVQTQIASYSLL